MGARTNKENANQYAVNGVIPITYIIPQFMAAMTIAKNVFINSPRVIK